MGERGSYEVELRSMLAQASGIRSSDEPGRWTVETVHRSAPREVIVELDPEDRLLVVITAYPVDMP